ncbi:uncharacterized protein LOC105628378 isoform X2 [Jatropha curcas]|uniref:uncharacterized protein LOC105628378 isoform X2 n=1 Tax=Jatropha curcas TaxID=180498 RepID=UPI0005FBEB32|nr:uncharacterized protein LOC105628378 isoform X2 [Jatropha curcas]
MSNKEVQEFFHSLSRKELQSLCKKYGLPARKSSSEMAESLFSSFQKKDLSLAPLGKSLGGIQEVLLPPSSLTDFHNEVPLNATGNVIKDSIRPRSFSSEDGKKGNKSIKCNELESCVELRTYAKEGFGGSVNYFQGASQSQFVSQCAGIGFFHKEPSASLIHRVEETHQFLGGGINIGVSPKENASPAINTCTKAPSSFEFYVSSEEGIKLCVDLDSSPLDWIKKYQNQVSLCNNVGNAKSRSLHQELGCIGESDKQMKRSFPQIMDPNEIKDGHVGTEPSPSFVMEQDSLGIDHLDGGNKSLTLSPKRSCTAVLVEVSDCLGEDRGPISSIPSSNMQNQKISNTESYTKNGYSATTLDSDISDIPTENTACNFAINSISNGSIDLIAIEHQNSKYGDKVCEYSTLQNSSNLENNCMAFPGCLASCSTEIQLSEAGNYHKDASCSPNRNCEFFDMEDSKHNVGTEQAALAAPCENGHCGNHLPTCSEELEWSNTANGVESSLCSQVDNSVEKTCLTSDNLESNREFYKKRPLMDIEDPKSCNKRDLKILRSMKHSAAEVLPRRSMRLVSKTSKSARVLSAN